MKHSIIWTILTIIIVLSAQALAQDTQQQVQDLEQRIDAYRTGKEPTGPTRTDLMAQVTELEAKLASTKSALATCKKAAE